MPKPGAGKNKFDHLGLKPKQTGKKVKPLAHSTFA
jgi:hypothetical protein